MSVTVVVISYGGSSVSIWAARKRKQWLAAGLSSMNAMLCRSESSQCVPGGAAAQPGATKAGRQVYIQGWGLSVVTVIMGP
jgi:hypothetical protein